MTSRSRRRTVAAILGVSLLAAACGAETSPSPSAEPSATPSAGAPSGPPPPGSETLPPDASARFERTDCRFDSDIEREVDCGDLVVPEDRSDSLPGEIRLHVGIFRSEHPDPRPDPIVFLDGGPGSAPLAWVPDALWLLPVEDRDVIIVDQRGTGFSDPLLDCPELLELQLDVYDEPFLLARYRELLVGAATACRDRLEDGGARLAAYSSDESAADIAALRVALGYDEWNLYGVSYGTRLALTILHAHPEGVRSVILDSVYPPSADGYAELGAGAARAFDALFAGCAADADCARAFPRLGPRFWALVAELDRSPVTFSVDVGDGPIEVRADGTSLVQALFDALYDTASIPFLPAAIVALEDGDLTLLEADVYLTLASLDQIAEGLHFSVQCTDEGPHADAATIDAAIEALRPELREWARAGAVVPHDVCRRWPTGDPGWNEAVVSDVPALILNGEFDPVTPPEWGEAAAASLSAHQRFVLPGIGHGVLFGQPCAIEIARDFLDEPGTAADGSCVDRMDGPNFAR